MSDETRDRLDRLDMHVMKAACASLRQAAKHLDRAAQARTAMMQHYHAQQAWHNINAATARMPGQAQPTAQPQQAGDSRQPDSPGTDAAALDPDTAAPRGYARGTR